MRPCSVGEAGGVGEGSAPKLGGAKRLAGEFESIGQESYGFWGKIVCHGGTHRLPRWRSRLSNREGLVRW